MSQAIWNKNGNRFTSSSPLTAAMITLLFVGSRAIDYQQVAFMDTSADHRIPRYPQEKCGYRVLNEILIQI
jgi:hypothetical protein